jgi:type II secretory pathway pseudopilin PulG
VEIFSNKKSFGFGLIEIILAIGIWVILISSGSVMLLGSLKTNRLADEVTAATNVASEGLDALKAIKKQGWATPFLGTSCITGCGLATVSGTWGYSGTNNVIGKYTRQIFVTPVERDISGNIVMLGGTVDTNTYLAKSTVNWSPGGVRNNIVSVYTYLTNYVKTIVSTVAGGVLVYGDGTTTPVRRTYDKTANTFSTEGTTTLGSSGVNFQIRTSPTKTEAIVGYVTSAGVLQVMCFDGTSWSNDFSVTVGGTGTTKRFDIAYETTTGDAMVLYSTNALTTNELAYRTKSGGSACGAGNWSASTNLDPVRTAGAVQWVKMAWDKRAGQNLITAIWADAQRDLSAMVWSGTAWGNEPAAATETSLEIIAVGQDLEDFDVEYESLSGDVMIVWANAVGANNVNGVRYRTCTGGTSTCTWGLVTTPATFSDDATNMDISANPISDEIVFASVGNAANDLQFGYWSGSAWTNFANQDTSCMPPTAGSKRVSTGWLVNGGTSRSIIRYADQGSSALDWYSGNVCLPNKEILQIPLLRQDQLIYLQKWTLCLLTS